MPLARKTPHGTAENSSQTLPEALRKQISGNFAKDVSFSKTDAVNQSSRGLDISGGEGNTGKAEKQDKAESKSARYADVVNVRLSSGKRSEFKKFFTECEISMNQGFEMAVDYVVREAAAGRISVSKSGIIKAEEAVQL